MRTLLLVLAVLANVPALAHADSSPARFEEWSEAVPLPSASTSQDGPAPQQPDPEEPAFTIGLNSPLGWLMQSFGGSLSVGLGGHGALRATFTRNQAEPIPLLLVTGGESAPVFGRIIDAGLGWVWYPRQLWDGFTIEAGALLRNRRDSAHHEDVSIVKTHSMTYAARAMIGWSWRITHHTFLAIAAGVSVGHETGRETTSPYEPKPDGMDVTRQLSRVAITPESYLRFGLAFGP